MGGCSQRELGQPHALVVGQLQNQWPKVAGLVVAEEEDATAGFFALLEPGSRRRSAASAARLLTNADIGI
jgi:hypothetical protein